MIAHSGAGSPGSPTGCSTSPRPSRDRSCSSRSGRRRGCRTPTGSPRSTSAAAALVVPDLVADRTTSPMRSFGTPVYQGSTRRGGFAASRRRRGAGRRPGAGARISAAEVAIQHHHAASLPGAAAGVGPRWRRLTGPGRGRARRQATFLQVACDLLPPDDERHADLLGRRAVALGGHCASTMRSPRPAPRPRRDQDGDRRGRRRRAGHRGQQHPRLAARRCSDRSPVRAGRHGPADVAALTLLNLYRREQPTPPIPACRSTCPGARRAADPARVRAARPPRRPGSLRRRRRSRPP